MDEQYVGRREVWAEEVWALPSDQLDRHHLHGFGRVLLRDGDRLGVHAADELGHLARVLAMDPQCLSAADERVSTETKVIQ